MTEDIYRIVGTTVIGSVFFIGLSWLNYGCRRSMECVDEDDGDRPVFYGIYNKWYAKGIYTNAHQSHKID